MWQLRVIFVREPGTTIFTETRPTMSRRDRKPMRPRAFDALETRCLLTAPQILGNTGQILNSQFQPFVVRSTVTGQFRDVKTRGPIKFDVVNPGPSTGAVDDSNPPPNSGLIQSSQFNGGGFLTVGLQFDHDYLGGGLTVSGFDNENNGAVTPAVSVSRGPDIDPDTFRLPTLANAGLVSNSQYNDGGFGVLERDAAGKITSRAGRVGFQWRDSRVRGPVNVGLGIEIIAPGAPPTPPPASAIPDVVSAGLDDASTGSPPTSTVINFITNMGQIQGSQFNDGGFGDIGMQWSNVTVGGHLATSSNTLFITPQQADYPPITVENQVFGQTAAGASAGANTSTLSNDAVAQSTGAAPVATVDDFPILTTYDNAPTNSGRLVGAQFNDGGFGDVGLQWRKVSVGGSVTAVHNSLTVQPSNNGQGLITVQGIQFPSTPVPLPRPARTRVRTLPDNPPVIASDGISIKKKLPKPTGPLSPRFPIPLSGAGTKTLHVSGNYPLVNAATNSGLVRGGQFNAGGFGDEGLQWQKVHVGSNVQIVHNSLSVHPEGTKLAGISVSNVSYGPPVSPGVAKHLSVLPYAVISAGPDVTGAATAVVGTTGVHPKFDETKILNPPNGRWLTNQQLGSLNGADVYLQWNGIEHKRGLVLVHNIIQITGVGSSTGPITLSNIRFPFRVPTFAPLVTVTDPSKASAAASASASAQPQAATATVHSRAASAKAHPRAATAKVSPRGAELLNVTNNSGIVSHAQFSDGGFGDMGLQWRNVSVAGSVAVVHNTLAVDTTTDPSATDMPGPITVSNVTFNSGALSGRLRRSRNQVIVSPPDVLQRASTHRVNLGQPLPQSRNVRNESTNTGILAGGQLSSGGSKHVMLQWQCVKVGGKVTVEDNVLSISVLDRPSAPINISNVTFA